MDTTTLEIQGMHCDGCAQRVKRALEREPGVETADVSLKDRKATVEYDAHKTPATHLREVVERAGYTAEVAG